MWVRRQSCRQRLASRRGLRAATAACRAAQRADSVVN
jgi:hypothetical protein